MRAKVRHGQMPPARRVSRDGADPRDPRWSINGTQPPLPDWLQEIRPHQLDAVEQVAKEFDNGARVVFVDAPTGTGKTVIGELVRRELQVDRGLYVCSTKSLQQQVVGEEGGFGYARVLKGRANYTPTRLMRGERDGYRQGLGGSRGLGITCQDCDAGPQGVPAEDKSCTYCEFVEDCPYTVARQEAMHAPIGVLNTAYLLAECNGPGKFGGRDLVVADEADLLEDELLGFVELRLSKRVVDRLGVEVPKKGSHMTTIRGWLGEDVLPKMTEDLRGLRKLSDLEGRREAMRVERLVADVERVVAREEGWVRDNDEEGTRDGLVLKPVSVEDVGERYLWRHAARWLCMTGTLVSAEMEADSLGLEAAGIPWAKVEVPMLFPRDNRRVVYAPVGTMTRKGQEAGAVKKVLVGIDRVLARHPGVNVLVHSHTYKLAKEITNHLTGGRMPRVTSDGRGVVTYDSSMGRDRALARFRELAELGGGVMVAASMDRGVDLPGDLCRVQIIAKTPMASLGSRQVSERLRSPGGQLWYTVQTVRSVMQMCGRAVRGMDDSAVTYVLDAHFGKLYADGKKMGLWPEWWMEAVEVGRVREFV